jgi:hypothetical protein
MLGRKVLDPIRFVVEWDPAIDKSQCEYSEYRDALYDFSKLKFHAGQKPTVFTLKQCELGQRVTLGNLSGGEAAVFAIRCSLTDIADYVIEKPDGSRGVIGKPAREGTAHGSLVTEEWMAQAGFADDEMLVLFLAIREISEARAPLSPPSKPPPGPGESNAETESKDPK